MQKILKSYLRRLTNLTSSNRSLVLLRLYVQQFLDVHAFDFASNKPSFSIIEALMGRKQVIEICPVIDPRDNVANDLSQRVRKLARFDKFLFEEQGSRDLYVGWPFVHGKFSDGTLVRCPLMFFPVEMEIVKDNWVLKQRDEVNVTFNKSFLLAYGYFNGVKIEDDFLDRVFDDFDTDSTVFRTALYQVLKESPVKINFNPETFADKLQSFKAYRKDEFESDHKNGELKVVQEAVLGIFPQAGSQLVPDYIHMQEHLKAESMEEFFADGNSISDKSIKEERVITPFALDAYQESAIHAATKGSSLVVQGPPGTGKSQLICNLISDAIATGKTVLLVSQKRAALDVVYSRLKEKEISPYVGLIHDYKNDRKALYDQITAQVDRIEEYQFRNNGLDLIQLERDFQSSSRTIDRLSEELREYKHALFDETECEMSIKELYLTSSRTEAVINLKGDYSTFKFQHLAPTLGKIREYFTHFQRFQGDDYVLRNRKSFHNFSLKDMKYMQEYLETIPQLQDKVSKETQSITGKPLDLEECMGLRDKKDTLRTMFEILRDDAVFHNFQVMSKHSDADINTRYLSKIERVVMDCYKGGGVESSLPGTELVKFQEALEKANDARKTVLGYLKWVIFSKDKFYIKRVLVANDLKGNKKGLKELTQRLDNRMNLEHNLTRLGEKEWIDEIPKDKKKLALQNWFHSWKEAVRARDLFLSVRNFKDYFTVSNFHYDEFYEKIDSLYKVIEEVPQQMNIWLQYFSKSQISALVSDAAASEVLRSTLEMDFDALCEFDKMVFEFSPREASIMNKLANFNPDISPKEALELFQNSLRLAWIDHIETKYPILRSTASTKFHKMVAELQSSVDLKQSLSNEILLLKSRERTYKDASFNRLNNMVTYRELYHQVTKKRRIWPLRKLLANFHNELFNLVPCWLASPESVSAVFPMQKIFDLVIFDEASQCFSERGLPAIYRGKQTIIAGDSQQLRPNDLYQVRYEEEEEEHPDLEVDSLLDLAVPYLPSVTLKGHYRSQSLDLIQFSNEHFYKGTLTMLPDKEVLSRAEPAIDFIRVDGTWESNVNEVEAERVVALVNDLVLTTPEKTIGIVTFNAKQQGLILDMLDSEKERGARLPESLFVKNIENVQGDERDIIIFSTAYAKDVSGRVRMNFGTLNAAGGENRLNVAITRAREKIFIINSLPPSQMNVEELKNNGPKLLKAYLEYAMDVSAGRFKPLLPKENKSHVTWYLKRKLQELQSPHYEMVVDMPFADLTLQENQHILGLILTDDDLFFQAESPKASYVYQPNMLREKHWEYLTFQSREYWYKKDMVEDRIKQFYHRLAVSH